MMDAAALVVASSALLAVVALVLLARRELAVARQGFFCLAPLMTRAHASAERSRAQSKRAQEEAQAARAEAVAARSEIQAMRELLHEIRDETCGPVAVRPNHAADAIEAETGAETRPLTPDVDRDRHPRQDHRDEAHGNLDS